MRMVLTVSAVLAISACTVRAKSQIDHSARIYAPTNGPICVLAGSMPADIRYEKLGRIVATKRSYGSIDELYPKMVYEARRMGADAIMELQASNRFKGPMPWRVTAPTGNGIAIKILPDQKFDCGPAGGRLVQPSN